MKRWKGKRTKAYQRALERGKRPPKWIKPFDWIEAILLVEEEYPSRQQAEAAERRYVRQMFPKSKYGLSTPGRRKFGPHKGTRRYIVNPQAPGKRKGKVYIQRPPSKQYIHKAHKAITGDVNEALGWRPGHPRVHDHLALFSGYYRTRDTLTWRLKSSEQRRLEQLEDERRRKPKYQHKVVVEAVRLPTWRSKWPGARQLKLFTPKISRNGQADAVLSGFRWSEKTNVSDAYSIKKPNALRLPKKLADSPKQSAQTIAAENIRNEEDNYGTVSSPALVTAVYRNVETYYIGRWGALRQGRTHPSPPNEGKYEGLNEILAEIDGEEVNYGDRRIREDTKFKWEWDERWANKALDAVADDLPALPWSEAYRYVGQMLEREKLMGEERFAIALQLSSLLKRLRQRGTLEWTEVDTLPDEKVPKADVITQKKAAELCSVSLRTIKSLENIYEKPEPPTKRTLQKIYGGLHSVVKEGVDRWQDTGLSSESYSKARPLTSEFVSNMTPQQYAATLSEIPTAGLEPLSKEMEWIIAVRVGQEIITLNLDTLYRERINTARRENEVKRDGILMGLARKRYGSWEDLAQAAFLGLWEDAGHKYPYSTDGRRKDAPVEYSLFIRDPKNPEELRSVFPGDTDPAFEAWAWKRGDSPSRSERRRDTTHRRREKAAGEEWKLALLQANKEITGAKADHNAAYLGGKKPIWNARHAVLLDIAKSHARVIPLALKWAATAKVLRVLLAILRQADPRRRLLTRVSDWPRVEDATPERCARIGETRQLHPIRRRLRCAHNLRIHRDRPPGWRSIEYIRRWYGSDPRPDDFQSLGLYPAFTNSFDGEVIWDVSKPIPTWKRFKKAIPVPMRARLDNVVYSEQEPIDMETEVWPGDALKDLEKLYKYKKLADERSGPRRAAELDTIKGVDEVTLGEATEDRWNPQRKGIDAAWDPEDDHGDLQREAPNAGPADELRKGS
jgi:transcriptional regulator with XRE-family HTH domain